MGNCCARISDCCCCCSPCCYREEQDCCVDDPTVEVAPPCNSSFHSVPGYMPHAMPIYFPHHMNHFGGGHIDVGYFDGGFFDAGHCVDGHCDPTPREMSCMVPDEEIPKVTVVPIEPVRNSNPQFTTMTDVAPQVQEIPRYPDVSGIAESNREVTGTLPEVVPLLGHESKCEKIPFLEQLETAESVQFVQMNAVSTSTLMNASKQDNTMQEVEVPISCSSCTSITCNIASIQESMPETEVPVCHTSCNSNISNNVSKRTCVQDSNPPLATGWQPRWFVLDNGVLAYYKSQEEVNQGCKGSIKMSVCEIIVNPADNTRLDLVIPSEQHFYLKAATPQERQQWLVALGTAKASRSARQKKDSTSANPDMLKTKKSELRLYCDLLMQQVHTVKSAAMEKSPPDPETTKSQVNRSTSVDSSL